MLKKILLAAALSASIAVPPAFAQWDYGQDSVWNSVENRIDIRKTRKRMQARKAGRKSTRKAGRARSGKGRSAKTAPRSGASTSPVAASTSQVPASIPYVSIHRDTFQSFHLDDSKGYSVSFRFAPVGGGKTISKSHTYTYYNSVAEFNGIPAGTYNVSGEAIYQGRKYPVHIASEDGEVDNPTGGNFAPSLQLQVRWGKNQWGERGLQTSPETLHVRVIE